MTHMLNHYRPLFCAACRAYILIPKEMETVPLPWRIALTSTGPDGAEGHAYCGDPCQVRGPARPEGERVRAFIDLDRTKGLLCRKGAEDALMGFLTPVSQHPEYLDGHESGMKFRQIAEDLVKNWPGKVK